MTQLTIALPDTAQAYVDEQLANGNYATADDLITALILAENKRQAKQTLNAMIREGLDSGEPFEATPEWWESQRGKLLESLPVESCGAIGL